MIEGYLGRPVDSLDKELPHKPLTVKDEYD
jgi:hypothetical protein